MNNYKYFAIFLSLVFFSQSIDNSTDNNKISQIDLDKLFSTTNNSFAIIPDHISELFTKYNNADKNICLVIYDQAIEHISNCLSKNIEEVEKNKLYEFLEDLKTGQAIIKLDELDNLDSINSKKEIYKNFVLKFIKLTMLRLGGQPRFGSWTVVGDITSTDGNITSTTGNISATNGTITANNMTVSALSNGLVRSNSGALIIGTAAQSDIDDGAINDAKIANNAAIVDTKLAQIISSNKVANSATSATNGLGANTIVMRDASNNFSAGIITASLNGNATTATNSGSFTGNLNGDVTGTQASTVVSTVGSVSAANVASGANLANLATNSNTPNAIVKRDASGNFAAGTISAALSGNATTATTATTAATVTGQTASNLPGRVVVRDANGAFTTGKITLTPSLTNGSALVASGASGAATIAITPDTSSKGITIGTTTNNAIEINTNKFTVQGSTGNTNIAGNTTIAGTTQLSALTTGVLHAAADGSLSSTLITNSDVSNSAAIDYLKLNLTNSLKNSDVFTDAAIDYSKLNLANSIQNSDLLQITAANKVANSATTATDSNVPNAIVTRDANRDFSAGTITANLIGSASLNVLSAGNSTINGSLTISGSPGDLTVNGIGNFNNALNFALGVPGIAKNVLQVTKGTISGPNQFNSIKTAVDAIGTTFPASSASNPYVIAVGAGVYNETDTITLPTYVAIVGESQFSCVINITDPSKDIIIGAQNSSIENCRLTGATNSGKYAIIHNTSGVFRVFHCRFGQNYALAKLDAVAPSTAIVLQACSADADSNFTTGFYVRGESTKRAALSITDFIWQPTTVQTQLLNFLDVSGANTIVTGNGLTIGSPTTINIGGTAFSVQNESTLRLSGTNVIGFASAINVPNVGNGPSLQIGSIFCKFNTIDLQIDNPLTTGSIIGTVSRDPSKIMIAANTNISLLTTDPENPSITTVGPFYSGETFDAITNISPQIEQGSNLGVISDGLLSTTYANLKITADAGTGYLMVGTAPDDNLKYIEWSSQTVTLPTNTNNFLYIDNSGTLQYSASMPNLLQNILLGRAQTNGTSVIYLQLTDQQAAHAATLIDNAWRQALGVIYISGSQVTNTGMNLNVSSGRYFYSTHEYLPTGGNTIPWRGFFRATPSGWNINGPNTAMTNQWDNGSGTLIAMAPPVLTTWFARHALYITGDGTNEKYLLVYAQQTYTSLANAQNGVIPTPPSFFGDNIALIASVIVQQPNIGTASIAAIMQEHPKLAFKAASTTGVTNHGDLTGLLNDDHPQYVLTNGGRTMTGNLNLGTNNIINAGTVNGVTVETHASRHLPNGLDPLASAAPLTIGTANDIGTANSFSRSDHVHAHGVQTDETLHALVTTTTHGFMSAADKTTLDSINPANFVQISGDTMSGTLTVTPTSGTAIIANGFSGSAAIAVTPAAGSKGITIGSTTDNAIEIDTDKFTVKGNSGDTVIGGTTKLSALTTGVLHAALDGSISSTLITNQDVSDSAGIVHSKLFLTNSIVDGDINSEAGIVDTKLAIISTGGKVANSATTATASASNSTIVLRDGSGNFAANQITASELINNGNVNINGNVDITGANSGKALKVTGNSSAADTIALIAATNGQTALQINGNGSGTALAISPASSSKGITVATTSGNAIEVNGSKFTVQGSTGNTTVGGTFGAIGTATLTSLGSGVVHSSNTGILSSSLIVDGDITTGTITDAKLATISTAGKVANSATTANSTNAINTIVLRDGSGNFSAGTITATLTGTATNFSGSLSGDVTGTQTATTVASVGGVTAANVAAGANLANAATNANTANAIVRRDASGNFSAGTITAALTGNASGNVLKIGDTMTGGLTINPSAATALTTTGNLSITGATSGNAVSITGNATAAAAITAISATNAQTGLQVTGNGAGTALNIQTHTGSGTGVAIDRSTAASGGIGLAITGSNNATAQTITSGNAQTGLAITTGAGASVGLNINAIAGSTSAANGLAVTGNISAPAILATAGSGKASVAISDGTAAAPSLVFNTDQTTGLYRIGASSLGITTGGTQRAIFDTNGGRFTSNYRVQAYAGSPRTLILAAETVRFDTENFDPGNNFDTSTWTYTAPVTGIYFVSAQLDVIPTNNNTLGVLQLMKGGVAQTGYSSSQRLTRGTNHNNMIYLTSLISLVAGNTINFRFTGTVGDQIQANDTSLSIHLLSI